MVKKSFFLLIFLFSCSVTEPVTNEISDPLSSEEVLNLIFEGYKNYSDNPEKTINTIWNFAHEENKSVTGPKERFGAMLTSDPYNSILDLRDYSYEVVFENEANIHYQVKVLAKDNNYFVITWVFQKSICDENPCWRTIGVSQPEYFESGI